MRLLANILLLCVTATSALALSQEEKTSRSCEKIYAELCKDVPAGDDRLVLCGGKHKDLKIPDQCTADYQQKFEGIVEVETGNCVSAARPLCKDSGKNLEGAAFLAACGKRHPAIFSKLKPVCKALTGE